MRDAVTALERRDRPQPRPRDATPRRADDALSRSGQGRRRSTHRRLGPLPVHERGRDLVEEPRGGVRAQLAPDAADGRPAEVEPLTGPGDADVGEPPLLLQLGAVAEDALVREDAVLEAGQEDDGVLESLGGVQGHEGDDAVTVAVPICIGTSGDLVGVGDERHPLEELLDAALGMVFAELPCHADELREVLHPALVLRVEARRELGEVAGAVEHRLDHLGRRHVAHHQCAQLIHQVGELAHRLGAAGGHAAHLVAAPQRLGEGNPLAGGEGLQARLGPVADAAARRVQDAPQADRVGGVGQHPQVGQRIPHFLALVEAHPADHLVGQADPDEHLFERPGLGIGAVEDGHLVGPDAVRVTQPVHLAGDEGRFVVLVVGDVAHDRVAGARVGPQPLVLAPGVLGDDRVGGGQDGLGRAVVLLQEHGRGVGVVDLEVEDVADVGAAEGVDRLVGVTHDAQLRRCQPTRRGGLGVAHQRSVVAARDRAGRAGELAHQDVLRVVGVLVLVDQDVPEPAPVVLGDLRERLEQRHRRHDEVVEVEGVGLAEPFLVAGVGLGDLLVVLGDRLGPGALPVDQLVLQIADLVGQRASRELLAVEVEVAADEGHQALGVGRVVDRELAGEPELLGLGAQDAYAGRVERQDPHDPRATADERGDALLHLTGSLVGEGDREDLTGLDPTRCQQVGDAGGQGLGLTGTRSGNDQQRPALVHDGRPLLRVEALEQAFHRSPVGLRRGGQHRGGEVVGSEQGHPHQSRYVVRRVRRTAVTGAAVGASRPICRAPPPWRRMVSTTSTRGDLHDSAEQDGRTSPRGGRPPR